MSIRDISCAILVALIWGSNFCVIKTALEDLPPLIFLTLRFMVSSLPFIMFIPRPKLPWKDLISISVAQWVVHFGLLFFALYMGMAAGLGSLLLQTQTIFTILLSFLFFGHRPKLIQLGGIAIALTGIVIIAFQLGEKSGGIFAFCLMIISAFSISVANLLYRRIGKVNISSVIVWSSLIPPIPMFLLSLTFEGWETIVSSVAQISLAGVGGILYSGLISTLIAANLWGRLMNRNEPSQVVPFSLLIPVVGITAGILILQETFTLSNLIASIIIISGLIINQWAPEINFKKLMAMAKLRIRKVA